MSWPTVKISEVAEVNPKLRKGVDEAQDITFLPMAAISENGKVIGGEIRKLKDVKKGLTYFERKDIIIAKITPCFENGKAAILNDLPTPMGFGSTEFHVIRPIVSKIDPGYLFIMLWNTYFRTIGADNMTGSAGQKRLPVKFIQDFSIPLPPLALQKKISEEILKSHQLIEQSVEMEFQLNALAQTVFLEMFGDPVINPKGWDVKQLKDLVVDFQGGKSLVAADGQGDSAKNRVLKISAVTSGKFDSSESKPLPDDYSPPIEHFVRPGDLLFSRANTTELVGATSLVFEVPENILLPDKLWRFVWKEPKSVSQCFFWQLLSYRTMREQLSKISSGSGGSMKNISKGKLNELQVIVPPLEKQLQFERIFTGICAQKEVNSKIKCKFENMFNALMQRAFSGKPDLKKVA
ncbi:restriction endonuclease subunit S [Lelliottia wanjuensis]|uniref:restriction endonuclease subunit S n=1 Tax=Lelliottia wanjuensis TaxID=3050585 RepID=UPI00254E9BFE|nr:restriction endonuclease subunit S [Lelliottia sp. V104_15]MDK9607530.1 restriction endonuclease subunit S [Lelliottia sp. V104_15]